jgi:hypothetical protein
MERSGWISALVLVQGRVLATWSHTVSKQTLRIAVEPLRRLPANSRPQIDDRAEELAASLGLTKVEVTVV